jgi:hypothetical protein
MFMKVHDLSPQEYFWQKSIGLVPLLYFNGHFFLQNTTHIYEAHKTI